MLTLRPAAGECPQKPPRPAPIASANPNNTVPQSSRPHRPPRILRVIFPLQPGQSRAQGIPGALTRRRLGRPFWQSARVFHRLESNLCWHNLMAWAKWMY